VVSLTVDPSELVTFMSVSKKVSPALKMIGKLKAKKDALHEEIEVMCLKEKSLEAKIKLFDLLEECQKDEGSFRMEFEKDELTIDKYSLGKEARQVIMQTIIDQIMQHIKAEFGENSDN
jgi:hypothetical protein